MGELSLSEVVFCEKPRLMRRKKAKISAVAGEIISVQRVEFLWR